MRKLLVIALATCTATGAFANVYYSTKGSGSGTWNGTAWAWKDASDDSAPAGVAAAGDGHTWVLIAGQKITGSSFTLPDTTWVWGSDGREGWPAKAVYYQSCNGLGYAVPHCTVYGCEIVCNSKGNLTLNGDFTFIDSGKYFKIYASAGGDERNVTFGTTFKATAGSDVVIQVPSKTGAGYRNHLTLQGDFSAFKGKFEVTEPGVAGKGIDLHEVKLLSETAMGDTSSPRTDAFTLGSFCKLAIGPDVVQSADRGVTFNLKADETAYIGTTGGKETDESTVTTPLYGSVGTLVKEDVGMVTIAGPMEMKNVVVREGSLKLAKTATLADDLAVTVEEGAVLYLTPDRLGKVTTTGAGEVRLDPIELEYHAKTETDPAYTTPVTLADGFDPHGVVIAIELAPALPLPLNETNRLAVVQIPNGKLTADDFAYVNAKDCDLPTTWFEVETYGSGLQTVYLVARPAIAQEGQRWNESKDGKWFSDNVAIHPGADYFMMMGQYGCYTSTPRNGAGSNAASCTFNGESYTVKGTDLLDYAVTFKHGDVRLYAGGGLSFAYNGSDSKNSGRRLFGSVYVDSSATDTSPARIVSGAGSLNYQASNEVASVLSGEGVLKFSYNPKSFDNTVDAPFSTWLTADNCDFTGKLLIEGAGGSKFFEVVITNANALGGSPAEFVADAVKLSHAYSDSRICTLRVARSLTIDDPNRGWTVYRGNLRTDQDVTLDFRSPLTISKKGVLSKDGPGTLALDVDVGAEEDAKLCVREGFLQVASPETLSGVPISFAELTDGGISVDAASTDADYRAKGLTAETLTFADEGVIKVAVANWTKEMGCLTQAVVTVPAGGPDLSNRLVPTKVRGATVTMLDPVVNADGSTTYRVAIEPSGLSVILR